MVPREPSNSEIEFYLKHPNYCQRAALYHMCKTDEGLLNANWLEFDVDFTGAPSESPTTTTTTTTNPTTTTTRSPHVHVEGASKLPFRTPTNFSAVYDEKCDISRTWGWKCTVPRDLFIHMVPREPSNSEIEFYLKHPNYCQKAALYHMCRTEEGLLNVNWVEFDAAIGE
eukprot:Gregarina_sp_Pseudo_9__1232@NODE_1814_length_1309_cov_8108_392913_g1682_i0_p2_GENE_NODE_1814_length_1309_cov_8108_392913_g1682_i0NODE_1814_length_1309_cov_8108_392913_g1682_i0_p2_ORF_typecomplete_len170_score9_26CBM_14/PF01607_24/7_4CBM_14/PF01607_24/2_9Glyco_hydro_63N/PF16923_5/5_5Glyco_hydro_63N/PF16923_5/4_5Ydr279_N/PF17745_1/32Ydr279_N/PF17745_1/4_6DUF5352/PF17303_2/35DUF5352/PF17303_2/5_2DUF3539/PF12058_8/9_9DUF3539/PF12058_8/15_NODE_1814_length_1309_cov_8108_392913_g1682_i0488997